MSDRYLLRDGDTAWMYLQIPSGAELTVGAITPEPAEKRGWWKLPAAILPLVGKVVITYKPGRRLTHYALAIDAPGYPATLTVEQYTELADPDSAMHDHRAAALYEPVHEETKPKRELVAGPWLELDGTPPPELPEGFAWLARLPSELRYSPEYLHLFPGHLTGFRADVSAALAEIDGVTAHALSGDRSLKIFVKVLLPLLAPIKWQKQPDGHLPSAAERRRRRQLDAQTGRGHEHITRSLEVPLSDRIEGQSLADALERWQAQRDEIVSYVRSIVARPCPACSGRGFTEDVGEMFPGVRDALALALEASSTLSHYNNTLNTSLSPSWRAEQILDRAISQLSAITGGLDADVIDGIIERTRPKEEHGT